MILIEYKATTALLTQPNEAIHEAKINQNYGK